MVRPFGSWDSSISAEAVAAGGRRFGVVQGAGPWIYWSESRPREGGRQTIMRARPGTDRGAEELLSAPFSARSTVHEYGGGEFIIADGIVYFTNDSDQDLYVLVPGGSPERLTNAPGARFADMVRDGAHKRLIAVCERPAEGGGAYRENLLVAIALSGKCRGQISEIAAGHDFYAAPRLAPDGGYLAYLAWDLPDMPWDQAGLYVAKIDPAGRAGEPRRIAGGAGSAVFQPEWTAEGKLLYVSDQTGWGNLYIWDGDDARPVTAQDAEFGRPLWQFAMRSYGVDKSGRVSAAYFEDGAFRFARIDIASGRIDPLDLPYAIVDGVTAYDGGMAGIAGLDAAPPAIVSIDGKNGRPSILRRAADLELAAGEVSTAELQSFPGGDGADVYGLYYLPVNARFAGPPNELPPAIIVVHGGPTASADRGLKLRTQFFTSRGFAVMEVDYAGSARYGRAYRERLDGRWGIADVADCAAAARHLADAGLADRKRIIIQGSSAGGYTVLMALATSDAFAAGSCHYGISDLELLLKATHKFESGYLHRLLGTNSQDYKETFAARSPLALVDEISSPVILFQGLDDKVVPPEQSRLISQKLKAKGLNVGYHEFAGEAHGFRRAETVIAVLNAEIAFFRKVLLPGSEPD